MKKLKSLFEKKALPCGCFEITSWILNQPIVYKEIVCQSHKDALNKSNEK